MLFGTYGHKTLEELLKGNSKEQALIATLNEAHDVAKGIMESDKQENLLAAQEAHEVAFRNWLHIRERYKPITHQGVLCVEYPLRLVADGLEFVGTCDAIVEDTVLGGIWICDHKFRKAFTSCESEMLNLQMIMYTKMARELGIEILGTFQNQIKPVLPKTPQVTLKGKVSKADIMTTWEVYKQALIDNNQDPDTYLDMKEKIEAHSWWDQEATRVLQPEDRIQSIWDEVVLPTSKKIAEDKQAPIRCFNSLNCDMCNVKEYCVEDMCGGDTEYLMRTSFKLKSEPSTLEIEIEDEDSFEG
jgi:hypothetical protein